MSQFSWMCLQQIMSRRLWPPDSTVSIGRTTGNTQLHTQGDTPSGRGENELEFHTHTIKARAASKLRTSRRNLYLCGSAKAASFPPNLPNHTFSVFFLFFSILFASERLACFRLVALKVCLLAVFFFFSQSDISASR